MIGSIKKAVVCAVVLALASPAQAAWIFGIGADSNGEEVAVLRGEGAAGEGLLITCTAAGIASIFLIDVPGADRLRAHVGIETATMAISNDREGFMDSWGMDLDAGDDRLVVHYTNSADVLDVTDVIARASSQINVRIAVPDVRFSFDVAFDATASTSSAKSYDAYCLSKI